MSSQAALLPDKTDLWVLWFLLSNRFAFHIMKCQALVAFVWRRKANTRQNRFGTTGMLALTALPS
jgi:hypothetical protein